MRTPEELLAEGTRLLGIRLDAGKVAAFLEYLGLIKSYSRKMNLTNLKEDEEIVIKHFLDSLSCFESRGITNGSKVVDIGSGAGMPGIPVKIVEPGLGLTLLEPALKKATFLGMVLDRLKLDKARVVRARAEEVGRKAEEREGYDIVLVRAVGPLSVLVEYGLPLLKQGGHLIAQKAGKVSSEISDAKAAARMLGGKLEETKEVRVPFLEAQRYLVIFKKERPTPSRFPRRVGVPTKKPLGKT